MTLSADDGFAIQQLYARYYQACDFGTADDWLACWVPDGTFARVGAETFEGANGLRAIGELTTRNNPSSMRRTAFNQVLEATPTGATCRSYIMITDISGERPQPTTSGIAVDQLVRTAEGWRIARRDFTPDR